VSNTNRTLCGYFGLPLQMGSWQDVPATDLIDWVSRGRSPEGMRLKLGA
jgi:hypothetical protein